MKDKSRFLGKGATRRILSMTLAVCMIFTMTPPIMAADETSGNDILPINSDIIIADFASLPDEVREQRVSLGTSLDTLVLPDTLEAILYTDTPADDNTATQPTEPSEPTAPPVEGGNTPPAEETTSPAEEPTQPAKDPTQPVEDPTQPVEDPTQATEDATQATEETTQATEDPTQAAEETTQAAKEPTQAAEEPTQAVKEPTQAAEGSTPPAEKPVKLGDTTPPAKAPVADVVIEDNVVAMAASVLDLNLERSEPADTIVIESVTWQSAPVYDGDTEGTYVFTAILPEDYIVESGVVLPEINVTVEAEKRITPKEVISMIDALPTMDEWTAMADNEARAVMNRVLAAKEAYDTLTDEEKVLIDEIHTAKLMELAELAQQLAGIMPMADNIASGISGGCDWVIDSDGKLTVSKTAEGTGILDAGSPWSNNKTQIKEVAIGSGVVANADSSGLFEGLSNCTKMDLKNLDTSGVTNMTKMFWGCHKLTTLDLSSFDTSNVIYMNAMFSNCIKLTALDLKNFDTSKVVYMTEMFNNCRLLKTLTFSEKFRTESVTMMDSMFSGCNVLTDLDVSNFNTVNVTTMGSMFSGCNVLTDLDVSNFNTVNVTTMGSMFSGCSAIKAFDLGNFNTAKVANMSFMFAGCSTLTALYLSSFNTSNVTNMTSMFSNCSALTALDLSNFTSEKVTMTVSMFFNCGKLSEIKFGDAFTTEQVTDMSHMFDQCLVLAELNLRSFNTANVVTMEKMFYLCKQLGTLTLSENFKTGKVSNMSYLFYGCAALSSLDLSSFNTASVTNMSNMFAGCTTLTVLDVRSFNTKNVTTMENMFNNCSKLTTLTFGDSFTTEKVTTMSGMFAGCASMKSFDLSKFNTAIVENMGAMFSGCSGLTSLDLSKLNTSNVTSMGSMFFGCSGLTSLDLSKLDTKKVTGMYTMFYGCTGLTSLDLSKLDTSSVNETTQMFYGCEKLTNLILSPKPLKGIRGGAFSGCPTPRYLTLVDASGMELNDTDLKSAIVTYKAVSDGDMTDNLWWGWTIPSTGVAVTVAVTKDGTAWSDHGKTFQLSSDSGTTFITDLTAVEDGTYAIYDGSTNTGVTVAVSGAAISATVPYHTATYNTNGGTVIAPLVVCSGAKLTAPATTPTKTGYTFNGWYKESGCTTAWVFTTDTVTAATTLYAGWKANTYNITLNLNGGSGGTALTTYTYGAGATLPTDWIKNGYVFDGWYGNADLTTGGKVTSLSATDIGNKEYWAKWTDKENPTISVSTPPTGWQTEDVSLTLTFTDTVGVTKLWVKAGSGTYTAITGFTASPYTYKITTEADCSYQFKAEDAAGNTAETTAVTVKLDKTAPAVDTANLTVTNGSKGLLNWIIGKENLIIAVPVTDALSGVEKMTYTATPDSGSVINGNATHKDGKYEIALGAEFSGTIRVTAADKAGNISAQTSLTAEGGKIIAEDIAPTVTITEPAGANSDGWHKAVFNLAVTVRDDKDNAISGGIQSIVYKIGENAEQRVADLPGTAPITEKTFNIKVDAEGTNTYYVKATDNAGNESAWEQITVKLDTKVPSFTTGPAVTDTTDTTTKLTYTPSEGGTVYWLLDPDTAPTTAQAVVDNTASEKQAAVKDNAGTADFTNLSAGSKHTIYVVMKDVADNLSVLKKLEFGTLQVTPDIDFEDLVIIYTKETIDVPAGTEIYTDPKDPEGSKLEVTDGKVTVNPGDTIYIRYPETTEDDTTIPPSEPVEVTIPSRPETPQQKTTEREANQITISPISANEEYVIVEKGKEPDWTKAQSDGVFTDLSPNIEYDIYTRTKATEDTFASLPSTTEAKTLAEVEPPSASGDGSGKPGNKWETPVLNPGGETIVYKGEYNKDYTPSIILNGTTEVIPTMTWDDKKGGSWEYTYTVLPEDGTVTAEIVFAPRQLDKITATGSSMFADNTSNTDVTALGTWLNTNYKVKAVYDNKVEEDSAAAYTTTDAFEAKGKTYTYTATVDSKTTTLSLVVKPVTAVITAPTDITKTKKTAGFTLEQLGLPAAVTVTYSGEGYTQKTDSLTASWTEILPADFGKTATATPQTINGTAALPAWATGVNTISLKVNITDKTALTDDQMSLTMNGWTYGGTEVTPQGSVTVEDTNKSYTYTYSVNGGTTWLDKLPESSAGKAKAGTYTVRMEYEGDEYAGTATEVFTVLQKDITVTAGTLAVTSKTYDGATTATLTGAPAFTGVEAKDVVTAGSYSGVFANANVGDAIAVTVSGFALEGADAGNYKLPATANIKLTGKITKAAGTDNPAYAQALTELSKVHIITNVTPTLGDVKLPAGWSFTGDKSKKLAGNDSSKSQNFAVKYTSSDPRYADMEIAAQSFPVTTINVAIGGGLAMRVIRNVGETTTLSPVTITVVGTELPSTGDYSKEAMEWSNSCPGIVNIAGIDLTAATVTAKAKGVSMVGISYKKHADKPFGYVLVQVDDSQRPSENAINEITGIADILEKIVNTEAPTETDKTAVNAVADEITKLPDSEKSKLTEDDVKQLDELKQAVTGLTVNINQSADEGTPQSPKSVNVVGAAIASGAKSGTVDIDVKPVAASGEVKMELKLEMRVDAAKEQLKSPLFFTIELPSDINIAKLTIKHITDGGSEVVSFTQSGQKVFFKLDSFSGLQFIVKTSSSSSSGGGSGSSGGSGQNSEHNFWRNIEDKIEKAGPGDTISIDAKDYDRLSWNVMDALRDNPNVTLVIKWNGGDPITIPAGMAQPKDPTRVYWPLSLLEELYKTDPVTGEPGKITEIVAPGTGEENKPVTPKDNGKADSESQANEIKDSGKDLIIPGEDSTPDSKAQGDSTQDGSAQDGLVQDGLAQDGLAQDASAQDGATKNDSAQSGSSDIEQSKKRFCLIDWISGGRTNFNCFWCWLAAAVVLGAAIAARANSRRKKRNKK